MMNVNGRRWMELEILRRAYLSAFCAANRDALDRVPLLTYENGWWCFRYRDDGSRVHQRVRHSRLREMTAGLEARSRAPRQE